MQAVPNKQVSSRLESENTWWETPHEVIQEYQGWEPRAYLDLFLPLLKQQEVRRAIVLMGPRRVGKTVMIHHAIQELINTGVTPRNVFYVSVDHPLYTGRGLEELLQMCAEASGCDPSMERSFVFFDEIQYLKDWEVHLKSLVDTYGKLKCVVSGSAAAALRLKSTESGAGRFTDFMLPPLTFFEYIRMLSLDKLLPLPEKGKSASQSFGLTDVKKLNDAFLHYLNFGGYPEMVLSEAIQSDPGRFIKSDIVDKVLLRDLPQLYGIRDIRELNYLFTTLAYNTAQEVSLNALSQESGVAKTTIKRYIEYLEAAFLVKVVHRIDRAGKRFRRANFFKVYLTNPSIRAALFSPITTDDPMVGSVAETGIFSQWFHATGRERYYARWSSGEVDIVELTSKQKPSWAVEVKWSDRYYDRPLELKSLLKFCHTNNLEEALVTTRTKSGDQMVENVTLRFTPASVYCAVLGYNIIKRRRENLRPNEQK